MSGWAWMCPLAQEAVPLAAAGLKGQEELLVPQFPRLLLGRQPLPTVLLAESLGAGARPGCCPMRGGHMHLTAAQLGCHAGALLAMQLPAFLGCW